MRKKPVVGLSVVLGLVLLAGAAYLAASWMAPNASAFGQLRLPGMAQNPSAKKGGGFSVDLVPAPGIPLTSPDLVGALVENKDNSLMVRPQTKSDGEASTVEVVVTGSTRLYRNATGDNLKEPPAPGTKLQMTVDDWTVAQINRGDNLIVWGERRGERIVADVILIEVVSPR